MSSPKVRIKSKKPIHATVGIDFGTSFTKIAYRFEGNQDNKVYPLEINAGAENGYLMPSLMAFDEGRILLGQDAENFLSKNPWGEGIRYLKMLFLGANKSMGMTDKAEYKDNMHRFNYYCAKYNLSEELRNPGYMIAVYLSWIIKIAQKFIREAVSRQKDDREIIFSYNICLPIDSYEQKDVLNNCEKTLNIIRDLMGQDGYSLDFDLLEYISLLWQKDFSSYEDTQKRKPDINLVPEAVALTACYTESLGAEYKIHGVIDIGAGTVDFSIFNINNKDGEKTIDWYNAVTIPGGVDEIEADLFKFFAQQGDILSSRQISSKLINMRLKAYPQSEEIIKVVETKLKKTWEDSRYEVWGTAYDKKNTDTHSWDKDMVKVLICGGGSDLPGTEDIFGLCWYEPSREPYPVEKLRANPRNFAGAPSIFHRMIVAYGLTIPTPTLSDFKLPKDCPDQTPQKPHAKTERDGSYGAVYNDNH